MDFEPALVIELAAIEGLTAKVFPLVATEGVQAPYVAYSSSEGVRDKSLDGYMDSRSVEVELNVIASSYKSMKQLTGLVLDKIISFQSRSIGSGGPFIQELTYMKPVDLYENLPKLYRCVIEFQVHF